MLLRLCVNMNVFVGSVLVCSVAIRIVYNYDMRTLGCLGRRATTLTYSCPLKIPAIAILFFFFFLFSFSDHIVGLDM